MKADSWVWDRVKEVMPTAKPSQFFARPETVASLQSRIQSAVEEIEGLQYREDDAAKQRSRELSERIRAWRREIKGDA
jgi:hypothetical protein